MENEVHVSDVQCPWHIEALDTLEIMSGYEGLEKIPSVNSEF